MICNFFAYLVQAAVTGTADTPINVRNTTAAAEIDAEMEWLYWD
jgi:hypothetical protein